MIAFILMMLIGIAVAVTYYYNSKNYFSKDNKKVQRANMGTFCLSLVSIVVGSYLLGAINWTTQAEVIDPIPTDSTLVATAKQEVAFEDSVYQYILFLNIKHPEVVFKQAKIESGNFKSKVFKENNNIFGIKQVFKRPNTQIGINRGYGVYEDWKSCLLDYALLQTWSYKNLTLEQYIKALDNSYATDPEYGNKLRNGTMGKNN